MVSGNQKREVHSWKERGSVSVYHSEAAEVVALIRTIRIEEGDGCP